MAFVTETPVQTGPSPRVAIRLLAVALARVMDTTSAVFSRFQRSAADRNAGTPAARQPSPNRQDGPQPDVTEELPIIDLDSVDRDATEKTYTLHDRQTRVLATDAAVVQRARAFRDRSTAIPKAIAAAPTPAPSIESENQEPSVEATPTPEAPAPAAAQPRRQGPIADIARKILETASSPATNLSPNDDVWQRNQIAIARVARDESSRLTSRRLSDIIHSNSAMRAAISVVAQSQSLTPRKESKIAEAIIREVRAQGLIAEASLAGATRESQKPAREAERAADRAVATATQVVAGTKQSAGQEIGREL